MNKNKRLEDIERELSRNHFHKIIMLFMVIAFGISTAVELYRAEYLFILCDAVCVLLAAINISMTDKEDRELISERESLLTNNGQIESIR